MNRQIIIEIKAKCADQNWIRNVLRSRKARFVGKDYQIDTYFKVNRGRLKLREGNIENNLIFYNREDQKGPKESNVTLFKTGKGLSIKQILSEALGVLVVVEKDREIYFIDNIKFHIDSVQGLGSFVEIEAMKSREIRNKKELFEQCNFYLELFKIAEKDLIQRSYSDLLLEIQSI
jgi:adenylate cyclase class 2